MGYGPRFRQRIHVSTRPAGDTRIASVLAMSVLVVRTRSNSWRNVYDDDSKSSSSIMTSVIMGKKDTVTAPLNARPLLLLFAGCRLCRHFRPRVYNPTYTPVVLDIVGS
jgi:hypothetical protein